MTQDKDLMVEQRFPISMSGYTVGKLMDEMECQILLDTGVSKSFLSKSYYLHCKTLHSLPRFASFFNLFSFFKQIATIISKRKSNS